MFLISPANLNAVRGSRLLSPDAKSRMALAIKSRTGPGLGEVYTYVSQLYFRGKLQYSLHFGGPERTRIIVPGFGLVGPDWKLTRGRASTIRNVDVDPADPRYANPLKRDLRALGDRRIVFLGSLASRKYLDVLVPILGDRLMVPTLFPGCGDMRRGALLLNAIKDGAELEYQDWREES